VSTSDSDRNRCTPDHRKVLIRESLMGGPVFADCFRFGPPAAQSAPLVIYVGGSIGEGKYRTRMRTVPEPILREYQKALLPRTRPRPDLLVLPFPPPSMTPLLGGESEDPWNPSDEVPLLRDDDWRTVLRRRYLSCLVTEILREGEEPLPGRTAFVGFSSGAYLAVSWALDLPSAAGAAALGGTGMAEAVRQSSPECLEGKRFKAFANEDDSLLPASRLFRGFLRHRGSTVELVTRPGGHSFADYAANGFVSQAFEFVLGLL